MEIFTSRNPASDYSLGAQMKRVHITYEPCLTNRKPQAVKVEPYLERLGTGTVVFRENAKTNINVAFYTSFLSDSFII